jgi:hypothetical protein
MSTISDLCEFLRRGLPLLGSHRRRRASLSPFAKATASASASGATTGPAQQHRVSGTATAQQGEVGKKRETPTHKGFRRLAQTIDYATGFLRHYRN